MIALCRSPLDLYEIYEQSMRFSFPAEYRICHNLKIKELHQEKKAKGLSFQANIKCLWSTRAILT